MKVAIIGSGAMGCRFGAALYRSGAEVWFYDVNQIHVDTINREGLIIEKEQGAEVLNIPATTRITDITAPDVMLLFTKTMYSRSAMEQAKRILKDDTIVVTMQNGLGNIELIEEFISRKNIAAGMTSAATDYVGPGKIRLTGSGVTKIMAMDETFGGTTVKEIAERLTNGGIETTVSDRVLVDIWEKVAFNCCFNTITFLIQTPLGVINHLPEGHKLCERITQEVVNTARADGVMADLDHVMENVDFALHNHQHHKPSMLQDREAGRLSEIDGIAGNVIIVAEKHGVAVPTLQTIYTLIKLIESAY